MSGVEFVPPVSAALQGFQWLYLHCTSQSADTQWRDFAAAIRNLDYIILRLSRTIPRQRFRRHRHNITDAAAENAYSTWHEEERAARRVLKECEALLQRTSGFQHNSSNFWENFRWGTTTQSEVAALRAKVDSHTNRLQLLHNAYAGQSRHLLHELRRSSTTPSAWLIWAEQRLTNALVTRFEEASRRDLPPGYIGPNSFPASRGLDALVVLRDQSTFNCPQSQQTIYHYLNLLKAVWLFRIVSDLLKLPELDEFDGDRLDADDFEHRVNEEIARPDLRTFTDTELLQLPENHFLIWHPEPVNPWRDQMLRDDGEEVIFDMLLPPPPGFQRCQLVVFRDRASQGGTSSRLVKQLTRSDTSVVADIQPYDVGRNLVIPHYGFPTPGDNRYGVSLSDEHGLRPHTYQFNDINDVIKFQSVLTNYTVASDFEKVRWSIQRPLEGVRPSKAAKNSRVQVWVWDPNRDYGQNLAQASRTSSGNSSNSVTSHMSTATATSVAHVSTISSHSPTNTFRPSAEPNEAVYITLPYQPMLVIYSIYKEKPVYLGIELHGKMHIDASACDCHDEHPDRPPSCRRSVLKASRGSELVVSMVFPDKRKNQSMPNLAVFSRSHRRGQPSHPSLADRSIVTKYPATSFILEFDSPERRREFNKQLRLVLQVHQGAMNQADLLERNASSLADRPQRPRSTPGILQTPSERLVGSPTALQRTQSVDQASLPEHGNARSTNETSQRSPPS